MSGYVKFNPISSKSSTRTLASLATLATAKEYLQKYNLAMVKIEKEFKSDLDILLERGVKYDDAIDQAYNNARPKLAQLVPADGIPIDTCNQCNHDILQGDEIAYIDGYSLHYKRCFNDYKTYR